MIELEESPIHLDLTAEERRVLRHGLIEWGGPARSTDEMAVALGFSSAPDLTESGHRLADALESGAPLERADWVRALLATEVVFASDVLGSGRDWHITTGISDEETIRLLRSIQEKIPSAGELQIGTWTRRPR